MSMVLFYKASAAAFFVFTTSHIDQHFYNFANKVMISRILYLWFTGLLTPLALSCFPPQY